MPTAYVLRYETIASGINMEETDNRNMYLIQVSGPEPKQNDRCAMKKWYEG
jgi:hypothetical protein